MTTPKYSPCRGSFYATAKVVKPVIQTKPVTKPAQAQKQIPQKTVKLVTQPAQPTQSTQPQLAQPEFVEIQSPELEPAPSQQEPQEVPEPQEQQIQPQVRTQPTPQPQQLQQRQAQSPPQKTYQQAPRPIFKSSPASTAAQPQHKQPQHSQVPRLTLQAQPKPPQSNQQLLRPSENSKIPFAKPPQQYTKPPQQNKPNFQQNPIRPPPKAQILTPQLTSQSQPTKPSSQRPPTTFSKPSPQQQQQKPSSPIRPAQTLTHLTSTPTPKSTRISNSTPPPPSEISSLPPFPLQPIVQALPDIPAPSPVRNPLSPDMSTSHSLRPSTKKEPKREKREEREEEDGAKTFVSSHYRVDEESIKKYLERKNLPFRVSGSEIIVKECSWCPPHKGKMDNMWKLNVSRERGAFFCHRCSTKGSWYDFKAKYSNLPVVGTSQKDDPVVLPNQDVVNAYPKNLFLLKFAPLLQWLSSCDTPAQRHLSFDVLRKYEVGATMCPFPAEKGGHAEHMCATFPWISVDPEGARAQVLRVKLRSMSEKGKQRLEPRGGGWGLFGWHTVPQDATEVVITEGEFDAMAVHQATGLPAISLPNGASSLPPKILPLLERFERIYLWMDDDVAGQEGAKKFARKLGTHRCYVVHARDGADGPKDANDALRMGKDLTEMIRKAKIPSHDQIVTFDEIRSQIEMEVTDPIQSAGVQSMWLPSLNTVLKGHRAGELTIVSGVTGVGKTSILSQLSIDYAVQGVRTLWGSFELPIPILVKKMLCQFAGKNVEKNSEGYNEIADLFAALPFYFLRFFGSTEVDQVIDAMDYAVYVHDVQHIIIDNVQFMISHQGKGAEKFDIMDEAINKFRQFATDRNVHLTLVIHPRKQDQEVALAVSDIFGNAKATQEADNVIIFQLGKQHKYLDIKKNRFTGDLGKISVNFDKESKRFVEIPPRKSTHTTQTHT